MVVTRGRHPGQGSRDPAVPVRKSGTEIGTGTHNIIQDWDRDSNLGLKILAIRDRN